MVSPEDWICVQDFRNLQVWKKSHAFVLAIYKDTMAFPSEEKYGIVSQVRRASVSIPANIAEGVVRQSDPELKRFLHIAIGSASEVHYFLILARDLELIGTRTFAERENQILEIKRMLAGFISKMNVRSSSFQKLKAES